MRRKAYLLAITFTLLTFTTNCAFATNEEKTNTIAVATSAETNNSELNRILGSNEPNITVVNENLLELKNYTTSKFTDVKSDVWYMNSVAKLVGMGGISGYNDKTFRPSNAITTAEFTKLLLASMGYKQDIASGTWYVNYVNKAKEIGVIETSDSYVYENGMQRKDMAKMICKVLNVNPSKSSSPIFTDTNAIDTSWIDTAFNQYLIRGYYGSQKRTFKPIQTATRAEVSEMIIRALEYRENPVEFKKKMQEQFTQQEKQQDELDAGQAKKINGYTIPAEPQVQAIEGTSNNVEMELVIYIVDPLEPQWRDLEKIMISKFGKQSSEEVITYVKNKTSVDNGVPMKDFNINGQKIRILGPRNSFTISVIVYKK